MDALQLSHLPRARTPLSLAPLSLASAFLSTAVAAIFLLLAVEGASSAETKAAGKAYQMQYKFRRGETLRYQVKHRANVRTTIDGKTQEVESQSDSVKAWKVTDVLPNGEMEFVHVVESINMTNQTPGGKPNHYNSDTDAVPPTGFEKAARAVGVPLSVIRIAADGKIVEREEKHPQPPATEDMPITMQLPDKPVRVGDKWDHVYHVAAQRKSGTQLEVRSRRVCRLLAVRRGIAEIAVEYQILTPVDSYVRSQLVERLTKGKVYFDIDAGRITSQSHDVDSRILGFAGKASSMHFLARLEEQLLAEEGRALQQASATGP